MITPPKNHSIRNVVLYLCFLLVFVFALSVFADPKHALMAGIKQVAGLVFGIGILTIVLFGIFAAPTLFKKLFPQNPGEAVEYETRDETEYQKMVWNTSALFFINAVLSGFLSYYLLSWVAGVWWRTKSAVYLAPMEPIYWGFPALFLGILLGVWFADLEARLLFKQAYVRSNEIYSTTWGFDGKKAMKALTLIFLVGIFGLLYAGFATYTRFTEGGIYIHRVYSLQEEYHPYTQVSRVEEQVRVASRTANDHIFIIEFSDGRRWKTNAFNIEDIPNFYDEMMTYVAQQSQVEFTQTVKHLNEE